MFREKIQSAKSNDLPFRDSLFLSIKSPTFFHKKKMPYVLHDSQKLTVKQLFTIFSLWAPSQVLCGSFYSKKTWWQRISCKKEKKESSICSAMWIPLYSTKKSNKISTDNDNPDPIKKGKCVWVLMS